MGDPAPKPYDRSSQPSLYGQDEAPSSPEASVPRPSPHFPPADRSVRLHDTSARTSAARTHETVSEVDLRKAVISFPNGARGPRNPESRFDRFQLSATNEQLPGQCVGQVLHVASHCQPGKALR